MKSKLISLIIIMLLAVNNNSDAQTVAKDFKRLDCNGNMHHLFADLDAGNVVILEFFMQSCSPCITAGKALESMKAKLLAKYPGKIKAYAIGFNNTYSCASNANWVSTNGLTSIPMDSGAAQVAYYGGMGMPTIVILGGGTQHLVLGSPYIGFSTSDTVQMVKDIQKSFNSTAVENIKTNVSAIEVYPNPLNNEINLNFNVSETTQIKIDISDISGKSLLTLMNESIVSGPFARAFNTCVLPTGYYVMNVNANGVNYHHKIIVLH